MAALVDLTGSGFGIASSGSRLANCSITNFCDDINSIG